MDNRILGEANIELNEWPEHQIQRTTWTRIAIREQVLNCTNCGLHRNCNRPVPASYPNPGQAPMFTVVGEAPGPDEDSQGKPFVGRSGRKLRELLVRAGLNDKGAAYCNVVSCFPNDKGRVKPPLPDELIACRGNLKDQLHAAGSQYVLLVGGVALRAWRGEFNISDVHGKVGFWDDTYTIMPVYHPSYVLRNRAMEGTLLEDLQKWRLVVNRELDRLGWLETKCWICGQYVDWYDRDGVAYCEQHWGRYGGAEGRWRQARRT